MKTNYLIFELYYFYYIKIIYKFILICLNKYCQKKIFYPNNSIVKNSKYSIFNFPWLKTCKEFN